MEEPWIDRDEEQEAADRTIALLDAIGRFMGATHDDMRTQHKHSMAVYRALRQQVIWMIVATGSILGLLGAVVILILKR